MADGLCGPSNALQNIQKHSTVDRTLQQDRIISRQTPSQGFRSTGQNAGFMDHEFEAFQAGQLPLEHGFQPNTFQHAPPSLQQAGPPSWAADFQRMNISSPAPQVQQQPFGMQAQQRQDTGGWHQDFARQQMAERSVQSPSHTASPFQSRMLGMGSQFTGTYAQPSQLSVAQQKQPEDAFDEAAFERAFDAAARAEAEAEALHDCAQHENAEMGQEVMLNESAEVLMASDDLEERADELLSQERIGADTIHDPLFDDRDQPANEDPEELARTAAKLLVSVQHEQSTKFQNSQFLSLMRQFRDREKTVEGDNVVTKNGMGGTDQDMNDERSQERIVSLCDALEHLALDMNPFEITPVNVRELLRILLSLQLFAEKLALYPAGERLSKLLQNLLVMPWIEDLHVCHYHTLFILSHCPQGKNMLPIPNLEDTMTKDGNLTLLPSLQNTDYLQSISSNTSKDILETYISSLLSNNPQIRENALFNVLPYTIPLLHHTNQGIHTLHAKEILGPYFNIQSICTEYGIWSPDLSVSDIIRFVDFANGERNLKGLPLNVKRYPLRVKIARAKKARGEKLGVEERMRLFHAEREEGVEGVE